MTLKEWSACTCHAIWLPPPTPMRAHAHTAACTALTGGGHRHPQAPGAQGPRLRAEPAHQPAARHAGHGCQAAGPPPGGAVPGPGQPCPPRPRDSLANRLWLPLPCRATHPGCASASSWLRSSALWASARTSCCSNLGFPARFLPASWWVTARLALLLQALPGALVAADGWAMNLTHTGNEPITHMPEQLQVAHPAAPACVPVCRRGSALHGTVLTGTPCDGPAASGRAVASSH
jgi:hypothetical protein